MIVDPNRCQMTPDPETKLRLATPGPRPPCPESPLEPMLGRDEQMILSALREIAAGPPGWLFAQKTFRAAVGIHHLEITICAFDRLVGIVLGGARRPFAARRPGASGVGADELALVNLIAAAQSASFCHASALARWLVVPPYQARLVSAAVRVGAGLTGAGICLVNRRGVSASDLRLQ